MSSSNPSSVNPLIQTSCTTGDPSTPKIVYHDPHVDIPWQHKGAIFYVNTNNGVTVLEDGTEIESIENRLLLFDSSKEHSSTSCTDAKVRVNINFNYF